MKLSGFGIVVGLGSRSGVDYDRGASATTLSSVFGVLVERLLRNAGRWWRKEREDRKRKEKGGMSGKVESWLKKEGMGRALALSQFCLLPQLPSSTNE